MTERAFDPSRYLSKVGNADYIEVKWRLVWLRELHPEAEIVTNLHSDIDQRAIFSAIVTIPGKGSATGWGSETWNDFRDYLEKAETKAIGRALAALGFGTQFCFDHDYGQAPEHNPNRAVVDSPVDRERMQYPLQRPNTFNGNGGQPSGNGGSNGGNFVTPRQLKFIQAIAREKGMSDDELNAEIERAYGKATVAELDRRDASAFIDRLQSRRPVTELAS